MLLDLGLCITIRTGCLFIILFNNLREELVLIEIILITGLPLGAPFIIRLTVWSALEPFWYLLLIQLSIESGDASTHVIVARTVSEWWLSVIDLFMIVSGMDLGLWGLYLLLERSLMLGLIEYWDASIVLKGLIVLLNWLVFGMSALLGLNEVLLCVQPVIVDGGGMVVLLLNHYVYG